MTETAGYGSMTRANLLEICRGKGWPATAWKRERMLDVLEGREAAPEGRRPRARAELAGNVLAAQLATRSDEGHDALRRRALENRSKRTGECQSTSCAAGCRSYAPGGVDAFHWQLCECGHTQWSHRKSDEG